jgi:hypothetical protein
VSGTDPDALLAYYMLVNHGWDPEETIGKGARAKALLTAMALREMGSRPKPGAKI